MRHKGRVRIFGSHPPSNEEESEEDSEVVETIYGNKVLISFML
jgi:hypothetical protein